MNLAAAPGADNRSISAPKVVEVLKAHDGTVLVRNEADEDICQWTAGASVIVGGGTIFDGIEAFDKNAYRRQGDRRQSCKTGKGFQTVGDEMAAHLDLVEQAAPAFKCSAPVQQIEGGLIILVSPPPLLEQV